MKFLYRYRKFYPLLLLLFLGLPSRIFVSRKNRLFLFLPRTNRKARLQLRLRHHANLLRLCMLFLQTFLLRGAWSLLARGLRLLTWGACRREFRGHYLLWLLIYF